MSNEVEVRAQARHALTSERIPRHQMEYELQFRHDGATPGLDRYHLHLRCFAAWEMERTKSEDRR
jgi:hypothetical protein